MVKNSLVACNVPLRPYTPLCALQQIALKLLLLRELPFTERPAYLPVKGKQLLITNLKKNDKKIDFLDITNSGKQHFHIFPIIAVNFLVFKSWYWLVYIFS